ncbi:MAG: M15 family metallopeptidase [Saprospiraceae bacterium]
MSKRLNTPIPPTASMEDWTDVLIEECGEDFVRLDNWMPEKIIVSPAYYLKGIKGAMPFCYARMGVAERLLKAANSLPKGYKLLIWDVWRPLEVQQILFQDYFWQLKSMFPRKSEALLRQEVIKFVSEPSGDLLKPSPHFTGGAVDLTIIDSDGNELDMGTGFDFFGEMAHTDYFELRKGLTPFEAREEHILEHRRMLYTAMTRAGFSNYPLEWWHYDYGNQFWGKRTSNTAFYGGKTPPQIPFNS